MRKNNIRIEGVKNKIKEVLEKSKVAMSTTEIRRAISEATRTILRIMIRDGLIKKSTHYLHNSEKIFVHPKTKKAEKIKGTRILKYANIL